MARIITRLNIGGPSIQAITLSRELRVAGFETCLIHGRLGNSEGDMTSLLPLGDVRSVRLDTLRRPISPLRDLRSFWRIYRALCRWRPHIVHTHMAKAGALGRLAALAYNRTAGSRRPARLVHTYHGHVFEGYFESASTRVYLFIEKWLGRRTDVLIAISPQVRIDLLEKYRIAGSERVRVVPLGFNLDRFAAIGEPDRAKARQDLGFPNSSIVVTTVGRLTAIKHHTLFLDAAAMLAAEDSRLTFLIVGDGELRRDLESYAAARGIASRVRFLGWRGDLERVYGATDVFLLTSRNEGTPVALIEAMASGVASVSTDVGGVADVVTSANMGILVPFGDAAALAAATRRLTNEPALRQQMGMSAREAMLERFQLRRLTNDICDLYGQLLRDKPDPAGP